MHLLTSLEHLLPFFILHSLYILGFTSTCLFLSGCLKLFHFCTLCSKTPFPQDRGS